MARTVLWVLVLAALVGGGLFYWNFQVETQYENGQLTAIRITRRPAGSRPGLPWQSSLPSRPLRPSFRIASFRVDRLDERKLADRRVADVLLKVIPQFEMIVIEGLQGGNRGEVLRLVEMVNNATGRQYDYAASPRTVRGDQVDYIAILFDQTAIEVDKTTIHAVSDPTGAFHCPPLVAQFRVRGPPPAEAFTFQLIAVATDPQNAAKELDLLGSVYRAVRDDGRNEDDVIVAGDLEADENHFGQLGQVPDLAPAIVSLPTTVRGTRRSDNLLINRRATIEFTGRAEVFDLMRECDLNIEQAAEVSEHLPVWAEFSSFEGGLQRTAP